VKHFDRAIGVHRCSGCGQRLPEHILQFDILNQPPVEAAYYDWAVRRDHGRAIIAGPALISRATSRT
jgi:hypothetical protein